MKVHLSVSTWSFIYHDAFSDPHRAVKAKQEMGHALELWLNWGPAPESFDREYWDAWKARLESSAALSFHTRNKRERIAEEIELLSYLGGRVLVIHPCVIGFPESPGSAPDLAFVRDLAAAACEHGVFLALENIHGRSFLDKTLAGVGATDAKGGLGICIDLGHAALMSKDPAEAPERLIRDYGEVLLHLHVHDVREGKDHVPLGTGSMDYEAIAAALNEVGFSGSAALEIQSDDPILMVQNSIEYLLAHGFAFSNLDEDHE